MEKLSTVAIRVLAVAGLAVAVYLALTRPITAPEARLWQDLIRPPLPNAFRAPDAWSGIFYALIAERFIGILRLSEWSLRAPSLCAGAFCAWIVWRCRSPFTVIAYAIGVGAGWFSVAAGHGLALALWFAAISSPRGPGWYFGLAVAASPPFALLGVIWWRIKDIERVLIPAAATVLILLLIPASQAGPTPPGDPRPDFYRELHRRNTARVVVFSHLPNLRSSF